VRPAAILVLWDIDLTLLRMGPRAYDVYPKAVEALTGQPCRDPVETEGRTELAIMHELLARVVGELPPDERICAALVAAVAGQGEHYRRDGRALPGAPEALAALAREPGVLQTVLTGNVRAHAEAKLGAVGLDRFIDFDAGAFGCDHVDRPRLVPIAQTRAGLRRQTTYNHANTVLVGDTRRDVQAGLTGGARVLGVATGPVAASDLRAAGAHDVLDDLTDTQAVLRAVLR
jgi:phosphoglycolate phosphatase-like HAD superfamily hydrolase